MNIPSDHECFAWVWKTETQANKTFIFSIQNGVFGYTIEGGQFQKWWSSVDEVEQGMRTWVKVRNIEPMGPHLPPICQKIRQMEARRKHVQYR